MQVSHEVETLIKLEHEGQVSQSAASEIMTKLMLLEHYPEYIVTPGEVDFAIMRLRYGEEIMRSLMDHIAFSLNGKKAIMDFHYIEWLPIKAVQDPELTNLVYTMYFKMWRDMRTKNFEYFPYEFGSIGATSALYTQLRGNDLLEFAGL